MKIITFLLKVWVSLLCGFLIMPAAAQVNDSTAIITDASPSLLLDSATEAGMTLFELLKTGGWVMVIIGALSVLALSMVIYYGITLREKKLIPNDVILQIRHYLRDHRYEDIARLCRRSKGMFSKIIVAGLSQGTDDPVAAAATMEAVGRREAETLMRRVRYLSEIATVSPMLGLLGTVLGMIKAFNFIAFDISAVKPVLLANAVAQALVTTAAGLIVAIPCMGFFFYFRGKLQALIGKMEELAVEISDQLVSSAKPQIHDIKRTRRKSHSRTETDN